MKTVEPSAGSPKEPRVETLSIDHFLPPKERHFDPMVEVANDGVDEVDLNANGAQTADPFIPPRLSLRSMLEIFMTTQVAHGQLFDELLTQMAALKTDFDKYRSAFPPPPPSDS